MKSRYIKISITVIVTIIGIVSGVIGIKTYYFDESTQEVIAPVKKDTQTIIQLIKKGIEPKQQLIDELEKKNQELVEELEKYTTKDKRAEEALVASKAGNYEKARELFETLREEEKEKEREHAKTAYNLGNVFFVELDFSKALEVYLDAVRLAPDNSTYLNEVGKSFYTLAQYDRAIEYYEKALPVLRVKLGNDHPYTKSLETNLSLTKKEKLESK